MINIRKATAEDVDVLYDLIIGIAQYHDQEKFVLTDKKELLKSGFSDSPRFGALIAEFNDKIAGYVSYTFNYSIWAGGEYVNIDDVFVSEAFRGQKVGEKLMHRIKSLCREQGIEKVRWEVQSDNAGAIRFYERLGAQYSAKGIFRWTV